MISFKAENPFSTESTRMVHGIMFILPSRQRFIPYSWLVYSEMNEKETEIQFHYTHTVVTVTGTNLRLIHEAVIRYEVVALRELTPPASARENGSTVSRIEIMEKVAEG